MWSPRSRSRREASRQGLARAAHVSEMRSRRMLGDKWSDNSSTDEMSGRTTRRASIRSENTVNFDCPYHGPQRATLTLRTHPRCGRDAIFRSEKGQILCTYSRCRVRVRFKGTARAPRIGRRPSGTLQRLLRGVPPAGVVMPRAATSPGRRSSDDLRNRRWPVESMT